MPLVRHTVSRQPPRRQSHSGNATIVTQVPSRVAYQGIRGSNSEIAARKLSQARGLDYVRYLPRVTSHLVVDTLIRQRADFGVVAVENSTAGVVQETKTALEQHPILIEPSEWLPITHHLCVRTSDITTHAIDQVFSHPQALSQCAATLAAIVPRAKPTPMDDTALAAKALASGAYGATASVLCSPRASEIYRLHVVEADMQDSSTNAPHFALIRLRGRGSQ